MTDSTPYKVPNDAGRWRAIVLAVVVHAALFALLWFGVRWQNEEPVAVEAEVWSPQPLAAAPRAQPPEPKPEVKPEPKPEVKPEVKPQPQREEKPEPKPVAKDIPKPRETQAPVAKADIALEQEKKKRKQQEEKERREEDLKKRKQQEAKERLEEEREAKLEQQKQQQKMAAKEKADAAKRKSAEEQAQKAEAEKKRKAAAAEAADIAASDARLREDMNRIQSQAGTGGTGSASKAQGGKADAAYINRIAAKIKSNIVFNVPDNLSGNLPVEYLVQLLPDGSVSGMRKSKSSGVPGFDEAVRRAIEKSQPYPKDNSGTVPSSFIGSHKPKDQ
ncbi:MAG: cell envelope integrity protein TolA [Pseudomonadota bacterium]